MGGGNIWQCGQGRLVIRHEYAHAEVPTSFGASVLVCCPACNVKVCTCCSYMATKCCRTASARLSRSVIITTLVD